MINVLLINTSFSCRERVYYVGRIEKRYGWTTVVTHWANGHRVL